MKLTKSIPKKWVSLEKITNKQGEGGKMEGRLIKNAVNKRHKFSCGIQRRGSRQGKWKSKGREPTR